MRTYICDICGKKIENPSLNVHNQGTTIDIGSGARDFHWDACAKCHKEFWKRFNDKELERLQIAQKLILEMKESTNK